MPATTAFGKLLDTLGKRGGSLVMKHPVLTAGVVGTGVALPAQARQAERLERKLMHKMTGKYSSCNEMEKFAAARVTLSARVSMEKVANEAMWGNIQEGMGREVGKETAGGLRRLLGAGFQAIKELFINDPKREKMVQQISSTDPVVQPYERQQPGSVEQAYKTMARFAPTLSTDPNLATSFLRNAAMSGGALDYQVVKGLADAEAAVQRAKNEGAWLRKGF